MHGSVAKPQEARAIHRSARIRSQAPGPEDQARPRTSGQSSRDNKYATLASAIDLDDDDEVVITRLKLGKEICTSVKTGPVDIDAVDSDIEAIESFSLNQNGEEDVSIGQQTSDQQYGQDSPNQHDDTTGARDDVLDDDRSSSETVCGDRSELELHSVAAAEAKADLQKRLEEARSKRAEVEAENEELEREIAAEEAEWEEVRLAQALKKNNALKRKRARLSRQHQD